MHVNVVSSRATYYNQPAKEDPAAKGIDNIWKKAGPIFFADDEKKVKSLLGKLMQPDEGVTSSAIKNIISELKGMLKAGYEECLLDMGNNRFLFRSIRTANLIEVSISPEVCYVNFHLSPGTSNISMAYACKYDDAEVNQHSAGERDEVNNAPELKAIDFKSWFTATEAVNRIARLTKDLFAAGMGATNKPDDKTSPAEMAQRLNRLSVYRARGELSLDYYKDFINDGIGNCQEQAYIAHLICHYSGIDSQLAEFVDSCGDSHMACMARFDNETYIIDPWADIVIDVTAGDYTEYSSTLESKFREFHGEKSNLWPQYRDSEPKNFNFYGVRENLGISNASYYKLQTALNNKIEEILSRPAFG